MNKRFTFILFLLFLTQPTPVFAQGITVSPSYVQIDMLSEQNSVTLSYQNTTGSATTLTFEAKGIRPETYPQLQFILPDSSMPTNTASWLQYDRDRITISPDSTESVTISIPETLSPGGHYAAFIANLSDSLPNSANQAEVALQGMLVTPVFVRAKDGNREERVVVNSIETNSRFWSYPTEATMLLHNKGNIETIPFAKIKINNNSGQTISEGVINQESSFLLPSANMRFRSQLTTQAKIILPGYYKIEGKIQTPLSETEIKYQFFSLGSWHTYIAILLIILITLSSTIIIKIRRKRKELHYARV